VSPKAERQTETKTQPQRQTMKKPLLTAAFALAGLAAFTTAQAQVSNAQPGDLLLGVEDVSGAITKNLVIDLGNFNNIANIGSFNIASDLSTVFGAGWSANSNLYYGVYGIDTFDNVIYLSQQGTQPAGGSAQTEEPNITTQRGYYYQLWENEFNLAIANNGTSSTSGETSHGVFIPAGDANSWTSLAGLNGNNVGGVFGDGSIDPIEAPIGSALDIYLTPLGNGAGTYDTTLTLDGTGQISAVPEPSTYALFGLGALLLAIIRRRRRATA
jgi:hypothetical protein